MIDSGLVSINFRRLSCREIVDLCANSRLEGIEWGGDTHVPHGENRIAHQLAKMTRDAGVEVAACGSYYRLGHSEGEGLPFEEVLEMALELGAPLVRVWAGCKPSDSVGPEYLDRLVADLREVASLARNANIDVSLDYHQHSMTDSIGSNERLLEEAGCPEIFIKWQAEDRMFFADSSRLLDALSPRLGSLRVFAWGFENGETDRRPLSDRREDWARDLFQAPSLGESRYALLEFVKDDRCQQLVEDAAVLNELLEEVNLLNA